MNKNYIQEQLRSYGFEVQPVSFNDMAKNEDIKYLQNEQLPKCDATSLLLSFPDYFIIHRKVLPNVGISFVKCLCPDDDIKEEIKIIYKKYFPERVIIINQIKSGELTARWFHLNNPELPLKLFLKNEMGI
jgi:hypothetical protein